MVVMNKETNNKKHTDWKQRTVFILENMFTSIENTKYFQKVVKQINLALSSDTKGIYKSQLYFHILITNGK